MQSRLIISVKEARKILGKGEDELDDTEVEEIIDLLSSIASSFLRQVPKN